jgi:tetratricopeptide (TPR) repeat protein
LIKGVAAQRQGDLVQRGMFRIYKQPAHQPNPPALRAHPLYQGGFFNCASRFNIVNIIMKTIIFIFSLLFSWLLTFAQSDSSDAYYRKGLAEKNIRRYMVAFNYLQKAVDFKADNLDAQMALGETAAELRKSDIAKTAFLKVLELKKDDPQAIEKLATLYFNTRKWKEAVTYGKKMLELKIGKNANYMIGKSLYEQEDYGHMLPYLTTAAKEDPSNAEIPYLIGRSYVDMSNYKSAAPYLEQAIMLDTTKPRWVYECALNFGAIPNDKMAIKYYLLAADRGYKTDNDYYQNLADSYIASGQAKEGIELLKKILERKPADLELLYNLAEIHYKTGKYQEAIDYWDKILGYDKQNARSLYMIGLSYQKKGEKEKGQQLCDKAIEMDPSLNSLKQKQMGL